MHALVKVLKQMDVHHVLQEDQLSNMFMTCIQKFLKQSAERISRIRETATLCTLQLLACQVKGSTNHTRVREHVQDVLQTIVSKGTAGRVRSLPHIISLMSIPMLIVQDKI